MKMKASTRQVGGVTIVDISGRIVLGEESAALRDRRVSTTLRQVLTGFSEFFHVSGTGLLIQTSLGRAGGLGALRTKRSG
jgi:anti-sigma B factor antagonist